MCLAKSATCHIAFADSAVPKPGIPVKRIPWSIFQKITPSGSSSTPCLASCGAGGVRPFAIDEGSPSGPPWHPSQCEM